MKKGILIVILICVGFQFTKAQCVVSDTGSQFFAPDTLPCIVQGVPYNQVIQISVPVSEYLTQYGIPYIFPLNIDSIVIDSVTGFPAGITDSLNPANGHLYGGAHACALVSGTTNDTVGTYKLTYHGTITFSGTPYPPLFTGDTTFKLEDIESYPQNPFSSSLVVITSGQSCNQITTGQKNFSRALNTSIDVYPNPSKGIFEVDLNAGGRLIGELTVIDITGRRIFSEILDIMGAYHTNIDLGKCSKGLYALQLRSSEGFASKNISVE